MPSVSEKQHRAMEAAAHGHSTLGIPKSVGKEFTEADDCLSEDELAALSVDDLKAELARSAPGGARHAALDAALKSRHLAADQAHEPDSVGRVHLDRVPISKANVCPYKGAEIPKYQELGLNPGKVYMLLRDPQELAKAAGTFNGIQVLHRHVPVSAMDHRPDEIVGSTGTQARFEDPYLTNSLSLWARHAIDGVEDESKRELSSSYEYDADMRPGTFQGQHYDGVMRNLRGNHVAIVTKGRAGPDVAIDEAPPDLEPTEKIMAKTAVPSRTAIRLQAALTALAMDERLDLTTALKGVTAKTLKTDKPAILKAVRVAFDELGDPGAPAGAPAPAAGGGATPDDVIMKVLDMVQGQTAAPAEAEADEAPPVSTDPNGAPPAAAPAEGAPIDKAKLVAWLKAKGMGDDDLAELDGVMGAGGGGGDADPPNPDPVDPDPKDPTPKAKDEEKDPLMVSKAAMDQAIAAVQQKVLKTQREIAQAADYVRPWVGSLAMDESIESASDVYRKALGSLGIPNAATLHVDALKPVLDAQPKPGSRTRVETAMAMDAASDKSLNERFPHFAHINGAA